MLVGALVQAIFNNSSFLRLFFNKNRFIVFWLIKLILFVFFCKFNVFISSQ